MQRSLEQLKDELRTRGIDPDTIRSAIEGKKVLSKDYVFALQQYEITTRGGWHSLTWGMKQRLRIDSPMLCFPYKKMKEREQVECMTSDRWLAERKLDGVRMIVTYCPEEGFGFFSRNVSVTDFMPVEYTDKILLTYKGELLPAKYFVDTFGNSFILDTEILCDEPHIDTTVYGGTITGTKLNAVTCILSIETKYSTAIQREQASLDIVVFDVLDYQSISTVEWPLEKRLVIRKELVNDVLNYAGLFVREVEGTIEGKEKFYSDLLAKKEEGIVLKHLDSPYISTGSRSRKGFVKRKRSVGDSLGKDIDAFISGFVPSNPDKGWSQFIGALEMSVILQYPSGAEIDHCIAAVSGMPQTMRETLTEYDADGMPCLNPNYLNKVLVINGQDLSPKAKRFMHATADWDRGFRNDKSCHDCTIDAKWLETQIL